MSTVAPVINPIFHRIVSASEIEDAVMGTLQTWFPTYLAEQERQESMRVGLLPPPQNYINRNAFDTLEGEELPKIVVISEGLASPPASTGQGVYHAVWRVGVGVATAAKTEDLANRMVKAYGAAVRALVLNKVPASTDLNIISIAWVEETYPNLNIPSPIMLFKAANISFHIDVDDVVHRYGGPAKPTLAPPPPYPESQTVEVDIQKVALSDTP